MVRDKPRMNNLVTISCYTLLLLACGWLIWTDLRYGIIPDWINGLIAALGLARVLVIDGHSTALIAASQGLLTGGLLLLLRHLYFRWRGMQGLGLGDIKFLAAATIWTGLPDMPVLLLAATSTALAVCLSLPVVGGAVTARTSIPFGPFLAAGLLVVLALQANGYGMQL